MTAVDRRTAFRRTRRTAVGVGRRRPPHLRRSPSPAAPRPHGHAGGGVQQRHRLGDRARLQGQPHQRQPQLRHHRRRVVAGHQNTGATGQSRAINLGVIGVTLAGEGCDGGDPTLAEEDQPQPVIARSGEKGADAGLQGVRAGRRSRSSRRPPPLPFAEAITTIAPMRRPGHRVHQRRPHRSATRASSSGNTREAIARTEIDGLSLGGGVSQAPRHDLGGHPPLRRRQRDARHLHDRRHRDRRPEGPRRGDAARAARGPQRRARAARLRDHRPEGPGRAGHRVRRPAAIAVDPEPDARRHHRPVIGGAQPFRDAVTEALLEQDCGNATYITVADIVLGGVSGAGQIGLELGGVQATTAEINAFQFAPAAGPPAARRRCRRPRPLPSTPRPRRARRGTGRRRRRRADRSLRRPPSPPLPSPPSRVSEAGSWR